MNQLCKNAEPRTKWNLGYDLSTCEGIHVHVHVCVYV